MHCCMPLRAFCRGENWSVALVLSDFSDTKAAVFQQNYSANTLNTYAQCSKIPEIDLMLFVNVEIVNLPKVSGGASSSHAPQ